MRQIESWLTLKSVPGIGNKLCLRLTRSFGSPEKVLTAPTNQLQKVVRPDIAAAIARHTTPAWIALEIEQAALKGYKIISIEDDCYPNLLRHIPDPPVILYVYGRLASLTCPVAVVGSRNATTYGRSVTHCLCAELAQRGATVVSGMARGIDTAAHQGALAGGGQTVAVLGSGLLRPYPPENRQLFHQIAEKGCVITEFPLTADPEPHHFPLRNRIISGMTMGTVVAEAARKSGSLITAKLALEHNREVFAVPGSVQAPTAKGTHDLIKQGAKLVENANDILEELAPQLTCGSGSSVDAIPRLTLSDQETKVFNVIEAYPQHIDTLAQRLNMAIGPLTAILLQLELKGAVRQEPGKFFLCCENAMNS